MHSPNFYHPAIFELVQRRKAKELATCEALLGAKQYLTAVEVFMKLNEINAKDLKDTLKDMADLSQVCNMWVYKTWVYKKCVGTRRGYTRRGYTRRGYIRRGYKARVCKLWVYKTRVCKPWVYKT
jgi:hypothetical protein